MGIINNLLLGLSVLLFVSCASPYTKRNTSNEGMVETGWTLFNPGSTIHDKPSLIVNSKVWYKDSFAIEEILSLKSMINSKNEETTELIKQYYRFNDLRKKMIYLFKNFIDTAVYFKKYSFDAGIEVEGGWGFNFERKLDYIGKPSPIEDTIINSIIYKRLLISAKNPSGVRYNKICMFRCDKNIFPFNLNISLSEKMKCPLVKVYDLDSTLTKVLSFDEIKFLSDTLTTEEIKIFDAWEKSIEKLK